jgi:hypothetical protein
MFSFIARLFLRSQIQRDNQKRQKKFLSWDKIEKIALIVNRDQEINKSAIDRFVDESKKFIEVFYIELRSKESSYGDWQCFSKRDRSFLNLPAKHVEAALMHKKFDVVINTCQTNDLFSASLTSLIPASFRCASSARFTDADIVIRRRHPDDLMSFINDTVHYLKMIKT